MARTRYGEVRGVREGDLDLFRGVPYAAPPVGPLRFLPPQPPTPWTKPRDATAFGPACMQLPDPYEIVPGTPMSEDCLTLNVWTPSRAANAPVMVFIHGGGFVAGTTRYPEYDGASLARHGVVVVSLAYRLGLFGWLDLSPLGPAYAKSANDGLLDQMAALRWVRQNIAAFGGDPANITVFGESAGAISISALLGAPAADKLFDRAIIESGGGGLAATREQARRTAQKLLKSAKATDLSALLRMPADRLLKATDLPYEDGFSDTAFYPTVDGVVLPQTPFARYVSGDGPRKPLIIGTTRDEARYWLYYIPEADRLPQRFYAPWLNAVAGPHREDLISAYRRERPELDEAQLGMALVGDVAFRMPSIRMAEAFARRGVDVRMYLATTLSPEFNGRMGAPHGVELPFVFGVYARPDMQKIVGDDPRNAALSDQVETLWADFAKGDPLKTGAVAWPTYDLDRRATLIMDQQLRVERDPYSLTRKAWSKAPFDGATPGLDLLTPIQFPETPKNDLLVIAAVIGWPRIGLAAGVGALAIALIGLGVAGRRRASKGARLQS